MFNKIQNYLLLRHPLLWNIKVVPLLTLILLLHIIFFVTGYNHGAIDFTKEYDNYVYDAIPFVVTFFSIIISIIIFIVWMVFYFRNNAFKSFYPQTGSSLYKEWLVIALISILNCTYSVSFMYAKDVRVRNYFTEAEFARRIDIISMASIFADGGFEKANYTYQEDKDGTTVRVYSENFNYLGKKYSLKSLLNKSLSNFSYQDSTRNAHNEVRVKKWLTENRKDSVLWLMQQVIKIGEEHDLKANITPQQWLDKVYNYPDFVNYAPIGRIERYLSGNKPEQISANYNNTDVVYADTIAVDVPAENDSVNNTFKLVNGVEYVYPLHYVPFKQLEDSYSEISDAWVRPNISFDVVLFMLYLGIALSLLVFSFRVTSGKNWLIAIVSFGITSLITGILFFIISQSGMFRRFNDYTANTYFILWLIIFTALLLHFLTRKASKHITGVTLNILVWLMPFVLPTLLFIVDEHYRAQLMFPSNGVLYKSDVELFIENNFSYLMLSFIPIYFIVMYFFTRVIKNWKGMAEA